MADLLKDVAQDFNGDTMGDFPNRLCYVGHNFLSFLYFVSFPHLMPSFSLSFLPLMSLLFLCMCIVLLLFTFSSPVGETVLIIIVYFWQYLFQIIFSK